MAPVSSSGRCTRREPARGPRVCWFLMAESTDPTLLQLRAALAAAYDIEAPIARGGMAHVYLARERRLDRRVAVKVLPPELAANDASRQRFLWEARSDAGLAHPHFCPVVRGE